MAGSRIKGITIELNGDTKPLQNSLKGVNGSLNKTYSSLRDVNKLLKLDPNNTELLRQKQALLASGINDTKAKLEQEKLALKQLEEAGKTTDNQEQQDALKREIIATTESLKKLEAEQQKLNASMSKLGQAGASFTALGGKMTALGNQMKVISAAAAAALTALGGLAVKAGTVADEVNTMAKKTHISTDELQIYAGAAELVDVSLETLAGAQKKLTGNMASAKTGTGAAAEAFAQLGVSVTDTNGELRSQNDVFNDVIAALGGIENETERDALAMKIFGKSASELNPLIDGGAEVLAAFGERAQELGLILDGDALDAANEFKDTIDETKSIVGMAMVKLGASLAQTFLPAVQKVATAIQEFSARLASMSPRAQKIITVILGIVAAAAPLLLIGGKLFSVVGGLFTKLSAGTGIVSKLFGFLAANPILAVVAAVVALVGALTAFGVSADDVTAFFKNMVSKVQGFIGKLGDYISANLPQFLQTGLSILNSILQGILSAAPQLLQSVLMLIQSLAQSFITALPQLLALGQQILSSILEGVKTALPQLAQMALELITNLGMFLLDNAPDLINSAVQLINFLVSTFYEMAPQIFQFGFEIVTGIASYIIQNFPAILSAGKNLIVALWNGIKSMVSNLLSNVKSFAKQIPSYIKLGFSNITSVGSDLVRGLWNGISNMAQWIYSKIRSFGQGVLDQLKSFFDIGSPSKVMADEIGRWIPAGIAVGIDRYKYLVGDAIDDLVAIQSPTVTANVATATNPLQSATGAIVGAFGGLSAESMYDAVRAGASNATIKMYIGSREMTREMSNLGFVLG